VSVRSGGATFLAPISGSGFGATVHDAAHHAFMTLPAYAIPRAGEAPHLSRDPTSCRVGLCVSKHEVCARQGRKQMHLSPVQQNCSRLDDTLNDAKALCRLDPQRGAETLPLLLNMTFAVIGV